MSRSSVDNGGVREPRLGERVQRRDSSDDRQEEGVEGERVRIGAVWLGWERPPVPLSLIHVCKSPRLYLLDSTCSINTGAVVVTVIIKSFTGIRPLDSCNIPGNRIYYPRAVKQRRKKFP